MPLSVTVRVTGVVITVAAPALLVVKTETVVTVNCWPEIKLLKANNMETVTLDKVKFIFIFCLRYKNLRVANRLLPNAAFYRKAA